jgi:hypothetical protein
MVRVDGSGTLVEGNVDWEPGFAVVIALRMAIAVAVIAAGVYFLTRTYDVNPIPGLLIAGIGFACFVVLGVALVCCRQVQNDDEKRVRAFFEDALKSSSLNSAALFHN